MVLTANLTWVDNKYIIWNSYVERAAIIIAYLDIDRQDGQHVLGIISLS